VQGSESQILLQWQQGSVTVKFIYFFIYHER